MQNNTTVWGQSQPAKTCEADQTKIQIIHIAKI
jgi:hypothetical protein